IEGVPGPGHAHHLRALPDERLDDGAADAPARTRDDGDLVLQAPAACHRKPTSCRTGCLEPAPGRGRGRARTRAERPASGPPPAPACAIVSLVVPDRAS